MSRAHVPSRAGARPRQTWLPLLVAAGLVAPGAARGFDLADVEARARALAQEPFRDPRGEVPDWLLNISYDQWRDIRFKPDLALWHSRGLPFEVQFFHPGLFYDRLVRVHEIDAEGVHPVPFSPSQFDYGLNTFASRVPQDLGYAGFRIHHPIKRTDYYDEVIVFLGATYFRAVGRDQGFGLSARGLAIDTALPSGEEFPYFREFWLVRPALAARDIAIFALLDSPRATGAYRFAVRPGAQTVVDVEARLFLREPVKKIGIAPLTSMFAVGENSEPRFRDYRQEVHDSDGVMMHAESGEWLWRPLDNPRRLRVSAFEMRNPRGFGLLQRDRDFDHYQDLETRPDLRPSAWIEPRGDWGPGHVELVEIPTPSERNDNIVAFWVPRILPAPREPLGFAYQLSWYGEDRRQPPGGRTVATRRDTGTFERAHRFVVDFEGPELRALGEGTVLQGVVTPGGEGDAELLEQQVYKNTITGGWRLVFQVRPLRDQPLELRAFLQRGQEALTETWTYVIEP